MGSGSGADFLSSVKMEAVWKGLEDQIILSEGKARVSSTSLLWTSEAWMLGVLPGWERSANGY